MVARILGLLPGDIVKILRPSPSAGEYISYRICSP
jgi:DNA-directed RNA polymerase subunit H (RpoH/RPB5)